MIVVATSGANHCQYCVVAHGAILRIRAKNPLHRRPGRRSITARPISRRASARCSISRCRSRSNRTPWTTRRWSALRAQGFTEDDAWDIAAIAAFFAMSNRLANVTSMRPNDEFYLLGRVPKAK